MPEATLPSADSVARLNRLSESDARSALQRCCGASRWVDAMLEARPFASGGALLATAALVWRELDARDYLEAFSHHPEIGADESELRRRFATTADLSRTEQADAMRADPGTLLELAEGNRAYRERFGYSFIVCAAGKSAGEMLQLLHRRLEHSPEAELGFAAAEQAAITRLRLEKL